MVGSQQNFTGSQDAGYDPTDLTSDFYLGWVVVDKSWNISKDFGVSAYVPQVLNGTDFDEDTNPLLSQPLYPRRIRRAPERPAGTNPVSHTKAYDLTGKTGIVIAFDSAYEQNQDSTWPAWNTPPTASTGNPILLLGAGRQRQPGARPTRFRDGLGNVDVPRP